MKANRDILFSEENGYGLCTRCVTLFSRFLIAQSQTNTTVYVTIVGRRKYKLQPYICICITVCKIQ